MIIKKLLSALLFVFAVSLAAIAPSLFAGCAAQTSGLTSTVQTLLPADAVTQLSGIATSVVSLLSASPLATTPAVKAAIGWAQSVGSFATQLSQGLASKDQVSGALTALCDTVPTLPLDSSTLAAISPYLEWAKVVAAVLPAVGSLVEQERGGAGTTHPTT